MDIQTIFITIAIGVGIASVTAWINIKIKFAQNADQAKRDTKRIFIILFFTASHLYILWVLITQLLEPLSNKSLIIILSCCFGLFHSYIMYLFNRLLNLSEKISGIFNVLPCTKNEKTTQQTHQADRE